MNENISQYLFKFLDNPDPQYAVMLKGRWGCGKSFFIKNWLNEYKGRYNTGETTLEPIYISLYGLKELPQVTVAIDRALYPYLYSKGAELTKKILKVAGKIVFRTNLDCDNNGKDDFSIDATLDSLTLLGTKAGSSIIKTKLIVFDDLERCLIDMKLLLGYINNFVEHGACHVIIIGDETHTTDDAQQKLIEFKEKTVGREFEIRPDINSAIDSFLKNDIIHNDWIANQKNFIIDCFIATKCDNLRILRQCLYDFSVLYSEIDSNLLKEGSQCMLSILGEYIITYCEYRGEFRELLKSHNWTYFYGIFGDNETKDKVSKFQGKYSSIIERYKVGILDSDCIKLIIREIETGCSIKQYIERLLRQRQGNMNVQDKLANFVNLSNEEFEKEYKKLEEELINNKIEAPYLMGRSMALLVFFDYTNIHTISKNIVSVIKEYVINHTNSINNKEKLNQEKNVLYQGFSSYGKFHESQIGKEILDFANETFEKKERELKTKIEEELLNLNNDNIEQLINISTTCNYKQSSIFQNIIAKTFAEKILHLNNTSLRSLCKFFSLHYDFCNRICEGCNYYSYDLTTLQEVYKIIEIELQNRECVDGYILRHFLKYLNGAIQRASGNNNQINIE